MHWFKGHKFLHTHTHTVSLCPWLFLSFFLSVFLLFFLSLSHTLFFLHFPIQPVKSMLVLWSGSLFRSAVPGSKLCRSGLTLMRWPICRKGPLKRSPSVFGNIILFFRRIGLPNLHFKVAKWSMHPLLSRMKEKLDNLTSTLGDINSEIDKCYADGVVDGFTPESEPYPWQCPSMMYLYLAQSASIKDALHCPGRKRSWKRATEPQRPG